MLNNFTIGFRPHSDIRKIIGALALLVESPHVICVRDRDSQCFNFQKVN